MNLQDPNRPRPRRPARRLRRWRVWLRRRGRTWMPYLTVPLLAALGMAGPLRNTGSPPPRRTRQVRPAPVHPTARPAMLGPAEAEIELTHVQGDEI
ncbi:MAG: hypothetical protein ACLFV7_15030 [Phycisphaerae bacterium]